MQVRVRGLQAPLVMDIEDLDDDLADVPSLRGSAAIPECALAEEPSPEDIRSGARDVRVGDSGVFCRHSYIISVLCLRIEEMLEREDAQPTA